MVLEKSFSIPALRTSPFDKVGLLSLLASAEGLSTWEQSDSTNCQLKYTSGFTMLT